MSEIANILCSNPYVSSLSEANPTVRSHGGGHPWPIHVNSLPGVAEDEAAEGEEEVRH